MVEDFARIPVDIYVVAPFNFQKFITAMGGMKMNVEDEVPHKYKIEDRLQTLDGSQALYYYVRWRGTPEADLGRIERQQRLSAALCSKALGWDTMTELPEIVTIMDENVEADMGLWEAIPLGRVLARHRRGAEITSAQLKGASEILPNEIQILVPNEAANETVLDWFRAADG